MVNPDLQYVTKVVPTVHTLLAAAKGDFAAIPDNYAEYLNHTYDDGDISLLGLINRFDFSEDLEEWELLDALEILGKVDPDAWPDPEDIKSINIASVLYSESEDDGVEEFAEPNMDEEIHFGGKVEKMLRTAIKSVYGNHPDHVTDHQGNPPCDKNDFLHKEGKYCGKFHHGGHEYMFECSPSGENDWYLSYRMHPKSHMKLMKGGG